MSAEKKPLIEEVDEEFMNKFLKPLQRPLEQKQINTLFWVKIVFMILTLVSSIIVFALVFSDPAGFTLFLSTVADYRNGASLAPDGYPFLVISNTATEPLDEFALTNATFANVGAIAATLLAIGFLAFLFGVIVNKHETNQMAAGANPYVWLGYFMWLPLAFLIAEFVAGETNVYVLVLSWAAVWAWVLLFWMADLFNNYIYRTVTMYYRNNGATTWAWLPALFPWLFVIVLYVVIIIYMVQTFGAAAWNTADGQLVSMGFLVAIPSITLFFYLIDLVVNGVYMLGWMASIYSRDLFNWIYSGILILLFAWIAVIFFNVSGVAP